MTPRRLIEPARLAGTSMLRTQSDARLVDLVRAGHSVAFEAIVQRYRNALLKYCGRLLPASRAEDAVQQTFLKAYQAIVSGDAELNLRPWLYRIAHNASLNLLRQNGWSHEELNENMDGVPRPDQVLELKERLRATVAAVNDLPERQRNAVLLREVEGLSYEEIALALGVGDGAVRQLLHRARSTLRAGASALTPAGIIERLAAAMASSGADPSARVAEVAAGIGGGAGALKLGAAVLATGALATGALTGPLSHESRHGSSKRAADEALVGSSSSSNRLGNGSSDGSSVAIDDHDGRGSHSGHGGGSRHGRDGSNSGSRHDSSHRGGSGSGEGSGEHRSGSGERSGSGGSGDDHHSGSGGGGSGDSVRSGPGSGSGDDHSGSSGSGGSDDGAMRLPTSDGGSSGSGTSGSGSSGDGASVTSPTRTTDGSGSPDGTSGRDGSGSSGSSSELQPSGN